MTKLTKEPVSISIYAERILYMQLKYSHCGDLARDSMQILVDDVYSIAKKMQDPNYKGQNVDQYLDDVEKNILYWEY